VSWKWRTSVPRQIQIGTAKLDVVAVEVFSAAAPSAAGANADGNDVAPVRVEILLPAIVGESKSYEATSRPNPG
jgi:hypothetical protein